LTVKVNHIWSVSFVVIRYLFSKLTC
jgi:hypothetical protein